MSWTEVPKSPTGGRGRAATADQIRWHRKHGRAAKTGQITLSGNLITATRITVLTDEKGRLALRQGDGEAHKLVATPRSVQRQFTPRMAAAALLPDHNCNLAWHREGDLIVIDGEAGDD